MKKYCKILSLLVTVCLVCTMNLGWAAGSTAGDNTAPVVNSMRIINPEIGDGSVETLDMEFDWIEEGVGILSVQGAVRNVATNQSYALIGTGCAICTADEIHPCFSGVHQLSFKLDDLPGGTYEFYEIYVGDDAGNTCEIFNFKL